METLYSNLNTIEKGLFFSENQTIKNLRKGLLAKCYSAT